MLEAFMPFFPARKELITGPRTAYNPTMEKKPDEPEDVTNKPLPSMSEPTEVQDAVSSTLATPFAQPIITITASKSKAQKQREYRQRLKASRTTAQAAAARKLKNERERKNRLRRAANLAIASNSLETTTASPSLSGEESNNDQTRNQRQHAQQPKTKAQIQREYRQRIKASRTTGQAAAAREARNLRDRNNRLRQSANLVIASNSLETTTASPSLSEEESNNDQTRSQRQHAQQPKTRAQIQREYRQRLKASRTTAEAAAAREARNLRDRNNRLRQPANLVIASGSLEATTTSSSRSGQWLNTVHIDTQRQFTDQQRQTLATEPAETTVQPSTSSDQIEVEAQSTWNTPLFLTFLRVGKMCCTASDIADFDTMQSSLPSFDVEKFIDLVRRRPAIWDSTNADYTNKVVKLRAWREIVEVYAPDTSIEEKNKLYVHLKNKWRNIRDCFVKTLRTIDNNDGTKKPKTYTFYENLLFLKDVINVSTYRSNVCFVETNDRVDDEGHSNSSSDSDGQPLAKRNMLAKVKVEKDTEFSVCSTETGNFRYQDTNENTTSELDDDRMFFLSIVKDFKRVPDSLQLQVKLDILNLIKNAQVTEFPYATE